MGDPILILEERADWWEQQAKLDHSFSTLKSSSAHIFDV